MKKKIKQTKRKKCSLFRLFGGLALCAGSFLILPVVLDKLTSMAYRIMYPAEDE